MDLGLGEAAVAAVLQHGDVLAIVVEQGQVVPPVPVGVAFDEAIARARLGRAGGVIRWGGEAAAALIEQDADRATG